jgi:thymidine kinase
VGVVVVIVDEAQFLTVVEVQEFWRITQVVAVQYGGEIRIVFAGLARDSDRREFPGTIGVRTLPGCREFWLLATCSMCGNAASETGRFNFKTGVCLVQQSQIAVEGTKDIIYAPVCGAHYGQNLSPERLILLRAGVSPAEVDAFAFLPGLVRFLQSSEAVPSGDVDDA